MRHKGTAATRRGSAQKVLNAVVALLIGSLTLSISAPVWGQSPTQRRISLIKAPALLTDVNEELSRHTDGQFGDRSSESIINDEQYKHIPIEE
jgi:hypothetical protein